MNSRSAWQQARPSRGSAALLRHLRLFFACAAGVLLVALAAAPGTAVAQASARSAGHGHARHEAVADAPRRAVLNVGLAHILAHCAHAIRSPALPPGQHDTEPGGNAVFRADGKTPWRHSDDADREPRKPLWLSGDVRTPLRSVSYEFEAAPAIDHLSRAPPSGYAQDRRVA